MRRLGFIAFVLIVSLSFLAGYWPQHRRLAQRQRELSATSAKLSNAESTIHLCELQGQLVTLIQETGNKNYADASGLSTEFFDGLRSEADNAPPSALKSSLESVLSQRDAVTAALARSDPKAHDLLMQLLADLSQSITRNEPQPKN